MILSTHLLEEVKDFISRAVLLREGRIVGDHTVDELEDAGEDLMSCIKRTYDYRGDRIQKDHPGSDGGGRDMKRAIAMTLVLFLLSLGGFTAVTAWMCRTQEQVEFTNIVAWGKNSWPGGCT